MTHALYAISILIRSCNVCGANSFKLRYALKFPNRLPYITAVIIKSKIVNFSLYVIAISAGTMESMAQSETSLIKAMCVEARLLFDRDNR